MMPNPYERPKKVCILCKHGIEPNYKNIRLLYQFVSPYTGKVYGKHITGLCKDKQEKIEKEMQVAASFGNIFLMVTDNMSVITDYSVEM